MRQQEGAQVLTAGLLAPRGRRRQGSQVDGLQWAVRSGEGAGSAWAEAAAHRQELFVLAEVALRPATAAAAQRKKCHLRKWDRARLACLPAPVDAWSAKSSK